MVYYRLRDGRIVRCVRLATFAKAFIGAFPTVTEERFVQCITDQLFFLCRVLTRVTFRTVRMFLQGLPGTVISFAPPLYAAQAHTILLRCKTLSFFYCKLNYCLTATGFLCYLVHEKSPLVVLWFVVNSLYHIEGDFSSFFGSHHFSTYNFQIRR